MVLTLRFEIGYLPCDSEMMDEWKDQEVIEGHAVAISAKDDQTVK